MAKYNKHVFTLRLEDELFDKIGILATKEQRSVSNYIGYILMQHIQKIEAEQGPIQGYSSNE